MKPIITKSVLAALAGVALIAATGGANAAKPVAGAAFTSDCTAMFGADNPFQDACVANQNVAAGHMDLGAYTGSCTGGAACADSVYNKLASAAAKLTAVKAADACVTLLAIQTDLTTWNTAAKQKIDDAGYATMSAAITTIQTGANCF